MLFLHYFQPKIKKEVANTLYAHNTSQVQSHEPSTAPTDVILGRAQPYENDTWYNTHHILCSVKILV